MFRYLRRKPSTAWPGTFVPAALMGFDPSQFRSCSRRPGCFYVSTPRSPHAVSRTRPPRSIFIEGPACGRSFTTLRFPWRRTALVGRSNWESQPQVTDVQQPDRSRSLRLLGFLAASKSCLADDESKNWISTITGQGRSCLGLLLLQGFGSGSSILARRRAE